MTASGRENKEISGSRENREGSDRREDRENRKRSDKTAALSRRMQMLADMVTVGSRVADVGCDHAFLPIHLVRTGKSPKCLAMDVRKGPLSGAEEHIAACGLGEYIETRLSDGLTAYHIGEAETLVCAGMGGRLMEKILTEGGEKSRSFAELILQPQSEIPGFRIYLRNAGFLITEEEAVYEEGKFYFAMKVVYKGQGLSVRQDQLTGRKRLVTQDQPAGCNEQMMGLYDLYGEHLLSGRHPVLKQYLRKRLQTVEELIGQLRQKGSIKSCNRQRELSLEKEHLERALEIYEKGW